MAFVDFGYWMFRHIQVYSERYGKSLPIFLWVIVLLHFMLFSFFWLDMDLNDLLSMFCVYQPKRHYIKVSKTSLLSCSNSLNSSEKYYCTKGKAMSSARMTLLYTLQGKCTLCRILCGFSSKNFRSSISSQGS